MAFISFQAVKSSLIELLGWSLRRIKSDDLDSPVLHVPICNRWNKVRIV